MPLMIMLYVGHLKMVIWKWSNIWLKIEPIFMRAMILLCIEHLEMVIWKWLNFLLFWEPMFMFEMVIWLLNVLVENGACVLFIVTHITY